jgi:RND family efflux transporter MFP subunit
MKALAAPRLSGFLRQPRRPLLLLPLLLGLAACGKETPPPTPKPRAVLVHEVRSGTGQQAEYSGEVRARHEVALAFRVGGKLISRLVEVGQQVAPGQVLARLDAGDFALNSRGAEASLAAAAAERGFAEAEARRYRDLRAQNFVSAALLDAKETALKAAEEKYKALATQAGLARNQAGYAELRGDAAGVVAAVLAEAGQVVAAGQPVLRVAKSGEREVVIAVPENRVDEWVHEIGRASCRERVS